MKEFKAGDKAIIVEMPEKGKHLKGEVVTIIPIGGFGYEDDDAVAVLENCTMLYLKEHQLRRIPD
jgi:hypothetical protein